MTEFYKRTNAFVFTIFLLLAGFLNRPGVAQTVEHPIQISIKTASTELAPGQLSAVEITFRIPRGFWLGDKDRSARIPSATVISMQKNNYFQFEEPQFPEPEVRGVPVRLGITRVFVGEITVIIPLKIAKNTPAGTYDIVADITYTPGLNAGHLSTHVNEPYSTQITVVQKSGAKSAPLPTPAHGQVPENFYVAEKVLHFPQPMQAMFHRWNENGPTAKFLHWLFVDPPNHGKHIQTVWHPFVGSTENNGQTIGGAMALMNVTREGIMTGTLDIRGYHNEYVGATVAMDVVSCPGAYKNYWFSAQLSEDRNRQIQFHHENLEAGKNLGYEFQVNAFQDPRYRFYGIGGSTDEKDETNYTHQEFGGIMDIFWLPRNNFRFSIGGKIRSVDVKRGADRLIGNVPFTINNAGFANVSGIGGATVVGEHVSFIYDKRNSEFTPSAGFYAKATAEYDQVTSDTPSTSNYGRFYLEMRKYFSTVDQKWTLLLRNSWTFTTNENIPFFDQATLGGLSTLRAFDFGRFYGQHAFFGSMEVRYQAMHMVMAGFPMDIEIAPFLDFGQVFNSTDFEGQFNVNPGMSMRFLNRPNIGIIANGALGQDGLIFTGGVSLPF